MHPINLPTYSDVMAASERIAGHAHRTPVLTSRTADNLLGCELFLKAENFQRMGAFKFRGAFNALSRFDASQRRQGVVAFSSGNHAQAIALSAKILGIPATIIMPHDAPVMKVEATKSYGAQVLTYNRYEEDREQISRKLAEQQGMTLIPPYDHADVIAGQGTVVKELIEEVGPLDALFVPLGDREQISRKLAEQQGMTLIPPYDHADVIAGQGTVVKELIEEVGPLDALFVPLGGGGLLSGSALSARALSPLCQIYGVEPEAGNDGQQSFQTGSIVHIDTPNSIADGAQTQHLGQLTFAIIREKVHDVLTVSDDDLVHEIRFFATRMKILVEPTGCLGFAGARVSSKGLFGKRVGVVISGGNVDLSRFCALTSKGGRSPTDPI